MTIDGKPAMIRSLRQQSLVAYLVAHRNAPQTRRRVADALWPESTDAQALTNLRRELHHVRKLLPENAIHHRNA